MKIKLMVTAILLLACLLGVSCAPTGDFDDCLSSIVKPHRFSIAQWEFRTVFREVHQWLFGSYEEGDDGISVVTKYFAIVEQIKTLESTIEAIDTGNGQGDTPPLEAELDKLQEQRMSLEKTVERVIEGQIKDTLAHQGILNFPPVSFELEKLPHLLVISPRDRIDSIREITLQPSLSLEEIESIEADADMLGVSSLVVELGGLAAYPSFVADDAGLRYTIDTAAEEWLHQYLVFKPLGFLYLLDLTGISRNYAIATMNETLASMVSKEIGSIICEKYYPECETGDSQDQVTDSEFDFNQEMREIRRAVDKYLACGEIEQAEEFMRQKRQYLAKKGYYIRKLNQAYFAFHGTYADSPTSISPIGLELKELRSQSPSLKYFLNTVASMTSRQELRDSVKSLSFSSWQTSP